MSKPSYHELLKALKEANEQINNPLSYAGALAGFGEFDDLIARAEATNTKEPTNDR